MKSRSVSVFCQSVIGKRLCFMHFLFGFILNAERIWSVHLWAPSCSLSLDFKTKGWTLPLLYRLSESLDIYTAVQNFGQSTSFQQVPRENVHAVLLNCIGVKILCFKRTDCPRAEFTRLSSYCVSLLPELGVTAGMVSSMKILLSWYFENVIRLIINAECALCPFMWCKMWMSRWR